MLGEGKEHIMKETKRLFMLVLLTVSLALMMVTAIYADDLYASKPTSEPVSSGTANGTSWEIHSAGDGKGYIIYFTKAEKTMLSGSDAKISSSACTEQPWYDEATAQQIKTIVIGDGITELGGGCAFGGLSALTTVEIPTSLTKMSSGVFGYCSALTTIYVRGNTPEEGVFDFTNFTTIYMRANNTFRGCKAVEYRFAESIAQTNIGYASFKGNSYLKKLILPEGVATINTEAFQNCSALESVVLPVDARLAPTAFAYCTALTEITVKGKETTLAAATDGTDVVAANNANLFGGCKALKTIKAYAGTPAAEFAVANGFTFIDIETGEVTEGTRPHKEEEKPTGTGSDAVTPTTSTSLEAFDPSGATAYGHMVGEYKGTKTVDTYWAFYADTKTLTFTSNTTSYNETGSKSYCEKEKSWDPYKLEIEHVIIGDYIGKITSQALMDLPVLKDVCMGKHVTQIDHSAFLNCTEFNTLWRNGKEMVEGLVDMTNVTSDIKKATFQGTSVTHIKLDKSIKKIDVALPPTLHTIYTTNVTEALIEFARVNFYDLVNPEDDSKSHRFNLNLDPDLPKCGDRCVYDFDEATGTLYIIGANATWEVNNYYGGGSKTSPWFSIKQQIKHVIIDPRITEIGKYAFTQCKNLETVQIPNTDNFIIGIAAFEKCENLRSIYREGTEPIEGTVDIRNVHTLNQFIFAEDYLIANAVVSEQATEIKKTTFDGNLGYNLKNIYSVPGSYAESYATENGLVFFDISANTPEPVKCFPPETTTEEKETEKTPETTKEQESEYAESEVVTETEMILPNVEFVDVNEMKESNGVMITAIVIAAAVVAAVAITIFVNKKTKKGT